MVWFPHLRPRTVSPEHPLASRPLKVHIVTPPLPHTQSGNELTAFRYARLLRRLGHQVTLDTVWARSACDVLIALHARRSQASIADFAAQCPDRPLIVVLTGTDLYRDIHVDPQAQRSLELASRLVVLQAMGLVEVPTPFRDKTRIIYQSALAPRTRPPLPTRAFRISVIGHLRPEKDPFRTALAARILPQHSRAQVVQMGAALTEDFAEQARHESVANPRYRWVGPRPHWQAYRLLTSSHVTSITSVMEGSSNVLCEALASSVPVVASRISGLVGTLGEDYPAYFPFGDTDALARVLEQLEFDRGFYAEVQQHCVAKAEVVQPQRELDAWAKLIHEVVHLVDRVERHRY
jgi:putative glycosyltransferase (TIGR04348 family)